VSATPGWGDRETRRRRQTWAQAQQQPLDELPDDSPLSDAAFDAKITAVLADIARVQQRRQERAAGATRD
jgi:hypothetical protein